MAIFLRNKSKQCLHTTLIIIFFLQYCISMFLFLTSTFIYEIHRGAAVAQATKILLHYGN